MDKLLIKFLEFMPTATVNTVLCLMWLIWAGIVYWTLKHPGDGRDRWLKGIHNAKLGRYYRQLLSRFLDFTAEHWFTDKAIIDVRRQQANIHPATNHWLGVNVFSEPAFVWLLKLALFYPVVAVFLVWVFKGQGGNSGDIQMFPVKPVGARLWTVFWIVTTIGLLIKGARGEGRKAMFFLVGTVTVALTGIFVYRGSFAVAGAFAFIAAVTSAGAGAIAVSVAVAVAVQFAVAVAVEFAGAGYGAGSIHFAAGSIGAGISTFAGAVAFVGAVRGATVAVVFAVIIVSLIALLDGAVVGAAAVAGTFAIAVTFAGAGAVAVAVAFAVAGAVAFSFSGYNDQFPALSFSFSVAVTGAFIVAFAVALVIQAVNNRARASGKEGWFWCLYLLVIVIVNLLTVILLAKHSFNNEEIFVWMLFFSYFPLLNAPLDWVSTSITRSLLYAIVEEVHSGYKAFVWALVDIVIALVLLVVICLLVLHQY